MPAEKNPPAMRLDHMVCFALYSAAHAVQSVYKPVLEEMGLTYPQFLVLTALWQQDDQPVGHLGAALHLESNTLTPLLKRMEAAGLVTRTRDRRDERQVRISLTDRSRALRAGSDALARCLIERSGLDTVELAALNEEVSALRDALRRPAQSD